MSRYIEIVFDNSGSMLSLEKGKPKQILAKEIFNEVVIPQLGKKGDEMVLRTLRKGCKGVSDISKFFKKSQLKDQVDKIDDFNNNTPLYLTLKDSIKACSESDKDEKFIFILTDGDDNCGGTLENVLTEEELRLKDKYNTDVILVQFAVTSKISQNNLTSLSQKLKAQNVIINQQDLGDKKKIQSKFTRAFINSGIDKNSKLDYCYDKLEDNSISESWGLLELIGGYDFYLAELLYREKLLSWKPNLKKDVDALQMLELEFVYTLRFKNNLPENLVKQMLSELKSPYRYSHNCIYWDFNKRKWKYHKKETLLNIIENPEAMDDDNLNNKMDYLEDNFDQQFEPNTFYRVELNQTIAATFSLKKINKEEMDSDARTLYEGAIVSFRL